MLGVPEDEAQGRTSDAIGFVQNSLIAISIDDLLMDLQQTKDNPRWHFFLEVLVWKKQNINQ